MQPVIQRASRVIATINFSLHVLYARFSFVLDFTRCFCFKDCGFYDWRSSAAKACCVLFGRQNSLWTVSLMQFANVRPSSVIRSKGRSIIWFRSTHGATDDWATRFYHLLSFPLMLSLYRCYNDVFLHRLFLLLFFSPFFVSASHDLWQRWWKFEVFSSTVMDVNLSNLYSRELAMNAKMIVQMDGKKTRIFNTKVFSSA